LAPPAQQDFLARRSNISRVKSNAWKIRVTSFDQRTQSAFVQGIR
jgi:hypothetical protein